MIREKRIGEGNPNKKYIGEIQCEDLEEYKKRNFRSKETLLLEVQNRISRSIKENTNNTDNNTNIIKIKKEKIFFADKVSLYVEEIEKCGFIETQNKDNIYYNFKNIHNKSNVPLDNFTWNDTLSTNAVRLDKIYTGTWNEKLEYSV